MKIDYSEKIQKYLDFIKQFEIDNHCRVVCEIEKYQDYSSPYAGELTFDNDPNFDELYSQLLDKWNKERDEFFEKNDIDHDVLIIKIVRNHSRYMNFAIEDL